MPLYRSLIRSLFIVPCVLVSSLSSELEQKFDHITRPGDDFYRYTNSQWLETAEIPEQHSEYGSFHIVHERTEKQLEALIENLLAATPVHGSDAQKLRDYYESFVDTHQINSRGLSVVDTLFRRIDALNSPEAVAEALWDAELGLESPLALFVEGDFKDPTQHVLYMSQAGLGLPNRDFYTHPAFTTKCAAYSKLLAELLQDIGTPNAVERAEQIMNLERKLAQAHWDQAKSRDYALIYNPYSVQELQQHAPGIPWQRMLTRAGLGTDLKMVVMQPDTVKTVEAILHETPVYVWKDYFKTHYLIDNAFVLPEGIDRKVFDFYGKELGGCAMQRERSQRGITVLNSVLGEALGRLYVEAYFPLESRDMVEAMVDKLISALRVRLQCVDWLAEETRTEALRKLDNLTYKIGYPDEWTDYSELEIVAGDAFGNHKRCRVWAVQQQFDKLTQRVDPTLWHKAPQEVNAYYHPLNNEVVFPAAILQPPFFDPEADPAANYGSIGGVIGHEISHGFDTQGRQVDHTGCLRDWWMEEDSNRFQQRTTRLGQQYAEYSPVDGMFVNAELTMGENIADLVGLSIAHDAYLLSTEEQNEADLTAFFMSWAQLWRSVSREEMLRPRLLRDPHAPNPCRANGVVRNLDAWYDTFDIQSSDALYLAPEDRVTIW